MLNFARVLKQLLRLGFFENRMSGENQEANLNRFLGYSLRPIHWQAIIFAAY
jgi:hypothetical protein